MKIVSLIGLFWLMVFCNFTTAKEETTMQTPSAIPAQETNKIPPWEVHLISQKDFINISEKLVRQIKTPQDLTLERIESITGLKFRKSKITENLYVYSMRFEEGSTADFRLRIEHKTVEQEIVRPSFSIYTSSTIQSSFFDAIELFQPLMKELGYKEYFHPWNLQMDWYQYESSRGEDRLLLTMPYDSESISIKAEEYVEVRGAAW